MLPRLHRITTHRLGQGLLRRPEAKLLGVTWGPVSLLWDRKFKQAERSRA